MFSMAYLPSAERLTVSIIKARRLRSVDDGRTIPSQLMSFCFLTFFTERQHSLLCIEPAISYGRVVHPSVRLSVFLSVLLSHAGTVSKRRKLRSRNLQSKDSRLGDKKFIQIFESLTTSEGVKREWGGKNSHFSADKSPYL